MPSKKGSLGGMMTTAKRLRWTAHAVYWLVYVFAMLEISSLPTAFGIRLFWLSGFLVGMLAAGLYWHRYRVLGWVLVASGLAGLTVIWRQSAGWHPVAASLSGLSVGVILLGCQRSLPASTALGRLLSILGILIGGILSFTLISDARSHDSQLASIFNGLSLAVAALVVLLTGLNFFRPAFELACEPVLWCMYQVRGVGPGFSAFPLTGPCVVIANHACWFDPIFLAKLLPRPLTPMMTGRFYDLPVISWLMRHFGIIRVVEQRVKREAPELQEAIAALDRGECLVVFPEGFLRRSEDKPLKRFGRGVWEILAQRPSTPVYCCWIEGNWRSYTSYFNGPPTRNKRLDCRRPITVAMPAAEVLAPEVLTDHWRTRLHLMNRVLSARELLNLPPLPAHAWPSRLDEEESCPGEAPAAQS